jgi:hypothetical protein
LKDLAGRWNGNDYQRQRVERVVEIIDYFLLSRQAGLSLEGRTLISEFESLCQRIGQDPFAYVTRGHALASQIYSGQSTEEDQKELLSFYHLLKSAFDHLLGGDSNEGRP